MHVNSRFVVASCLAVMATAVSGCGNPNPVDDSGLPRYTPDGSPTVAGRSITQTAQAPAAGGDGNGGTTGVATPSTGPEHEVLKAASLKAKDVSALGLRVKAGGDATSLDRPSLGPCGTDEALDGEARRTARYGVTAWADDADDADNDNADDADDTGRDGTTVSAASAEVVRYEDAGAAADALEELRDEVARCEAEMTGEPVGLSDLTYEDFTVSGDDSLPLEDNARVRVGTSSDAGAEPDLVMVLQRHEDLVTLVSWQESDEYGAAELRTLRGLGDVLGRRLLKAAT